MISVVISIYNAAEYLRVCLDSVLGQTLDNWECLLIDDGSTDGSSGLCDEYVAKDGRFRVTHQINGGVSAARNAGIDQSCGEYICFIDADDWVENGFLEHLMVRATESDWMISGQTREYQDGRKVVRKPDNDEVITLSPDSVHAILTLERRFLLYAPHEKLYRADIIKEHNIRFPENCSYGEDLIFNFRYLEHVYTIGVVAIAKYHYRIREDSLSNVFRPKQFEHDYSQWLILKEFHEKHRLWNDEVAAYLAKRLWGIVYDGIFLFPKLKEPPKDYLKSILSIPEIDVLRKHQDVFNCARWIKFGIVNRMPVLFNLYFKLLQ